MNNRREALKLLGFSAVALTAGGATSAALAQQQSTPSIGSAFAANTPIKPLNFQADQLDGISETVITSHHQNNYAGSVRAMNAVKERLEAALADDTMPAYVYNDLKREHLMRTGSVVLHELYFDNLAPPGNRNGELDRALASSFGSFTAWEKEFRRIASGLGGGSGWVMLAWNHQLGTLENYWMADHTNSPAYASPLLVMDMYEHSYHMDYCAAAGGYIDAFMRNVNWEVVARRFADAV
ncbi:MAG: Fe-Mn family superoxide dismutase [Gammaproteobacteria bacterium]|nr:superoxide dismutase [Pseudomonadales bacterium]MCP5346134.1 superoxide dismutase [Pseudomonadales bacterium]